MQPWRRHLHIVTGQVESDLAVQVSYDLEISLINSHSFQCFNEFYMLNRILKLNCVLSKLSLHLVLILACITFQEGLQQVNHDDKVCIPQTFLSVTFLLFRYWVKLDSTLLIGAKHHR